MRSVGFLDLAVSQIRDRDAAVETFENDLELLLIGPFTVFHMNSFSFPRSSDSTLFGL